MKKVDRFETVLNRGLKDEKRIEMPRHTAGDVWTAMDIRGRILSISSKSEFEELIKQTVDLWKGKLTFDDIMDGLDSDELMSWITDSCDFIINKTVGSYDDLVDQSVEETQKAKKNKKK